MDDDSPSKDIISYVLSPGRKGDAGLGFDDEGDADTTSFDALVHAGRKRGRSNDLTTPNTRTFIHGLGEISPADVSDEQAAQLLAAVEQLQTALLKKQQTGVIAAPPFAVSSSFDVNNAPPSSAHHPPSPVSASPRRVGLADCLPQGQTATILSVLAEAKMQLLQRTSPGVARFVARSAASVGVLPAAPSPSQAQNLTPESDAAFYDAVEAVYSNSIMTGLSSTGAIVQCSSAIEPNNCAEAATKLLTDIFFLLSPQSRARSAITTTVVPPNVLAAATSRENDAANINADVALEFKLWPLNGPESGITADPPTLAMASIRTTSDGKPSPDPTKTVAASFHECSDDDDTEFAADDLGCLDLLEKNLCRPPDLPPPCDDYKLRQQILDLLQVQNVRWLPCAEVPNAEVVNLLGAFGQSENCYCGGHKSAASGVSASSRRHDPALLLPVHLRCVVVAVSRVHTISCAMRFPAAARASCRPEQLPAVSIRQRIWCVAYLKCASTSANVPSKCAVAHTFVAVRGQWLECSRVSAGTVVHVVCVRSGRALANGAAVSAWTSNRAVQKISPDDLHTSSSGDLRLWALRGDPVQFLDTAEQSARLNRVDLDRFCCTNSVVVIVDDLTNALSIHPDMLLAPTRVAGVSTCLRRAVLSETMGDAGSADTYSYVAELGTLKHALFEAALRLTAGAIENSAPFLPNLSIALWDGVAVKLHQRLGTLARELLFQPAVLLKLVSYGKTETDTLSHLLATIPGIIDWMGRYAARQYDAPGRKVKSPLSVRRLVGAEDEVWSPLWGLKGIVDATVDLEVIKPAFLIRAGAVPARQISGNHVPGSARVGTTVARRLPLELKTGRRPREGSSVEHRAQVALYDLLMAERYGRSDSDAFVEEAASVSVQRVPATVVVPEDLALGAYLADGSIEAVGGLLVYLSAPEEQAMAAAAAAALGAGKSTGFAGTSKPTSDHFHYTSMVPALWPEQRGLLIMRNKLAISVFLVKSKNAGLVCTEAMAMNVPPQELLRDSSTQHCGSMGVFGTSTSRTVLPPLLQDVRMCSNCPVFAACATVYVADELPAAEAARAAAFISGASDIADDDDDSRYVPFLDELGGVKALYSGALAHVTPSLRAYLQRWLRLVNLEASSDLLVDVAVAPAPKPGASTVTDLEDLRFERIVPLHASSLPNRRLRSGDMRSRLWMQRSTEAETSVGSTISRLVLVSQCAAPPAVAAAAFDVEGVAGGQREIDSSIGPSEYLYEFVTVERFAATGLGGEERVQKQQPRSLAEVDLDVGDLVTASGDSAMGPYGLIRGVVVCKEDHGLLRIRGARDVLTAYGSWALPSSSSRLVAATATAASESSLSLPPWLWRVDRDELGTSVRVIRDNLVRFALGPSPVWAGDDDAAVEVDETDLTEEVSTDDDDMFAGYDYSALDAAGRAAEEGVLGVLLLKTSPPPALVVKDTSPAFVTAGVDSKGSSTGLHLGVGSGDTKRQRLLVDMEPPRFFRAPFFPWTLQPQPCLIPQRPMQPRVSISNVHLCTELVEAFNGLNYGQRSAVDGCLRARDYACILGMPGSGKTSTVAFIVRCIVAAGRTVLISSHTHSAVDTLLLKVAQSGVDDILRLGRPALVLPALRRFCLDEGIATGVISSLGALKHRMASAAVVGVTCLGVRHALFTSGRVFDYCIVDEASQIPEPVALGPLRSARIFILVGDHNQLPPLVVSRQARAEGMDVSLFKRLADAHVAAVFALTQQYRMNAEIQSLSNALVYHGALQCGTAKVAEGRYILAGAKPALSTLRSSVSAGSPHISSIAQSHAASSCFDWLEFALLTSTTVIFIDTDAILPPGSPSNAQPCLEQRARMQRTKCLSGDVNGESGDGGGGGLCNRTEALLVSLLCHAIIEAGGAPTDIGVIAPYRAQLRLIKSLLVVGGPSLPAAATTSSSSSVTAAQGFVEVETVDRYQGRDKPVIILSCVRSNAQAEVGTLLADPRRLNVALTRAKFKLVVIGSRKTLTLGCPLFTKMLDLMEQNSWIIAAPAEASEHAVIALARSNEPRA